MERRIFWLLSAAVVLLAFVLREHYLLQSTVLDPTSGDAGYYVRYAYNMLTGGYFGVHDGPDAYRSPGYPLLIAAVQLFDGDPYLRLLQCQVLMGTATVGMTIALGRQWLPQWGALAAGLLLAIWPHQITFAAEMLSEVFYGFLLVAALLAAALAKGRTWGWLVAGLLFACACMVNPVCALLPFVVGAAMIGRRSPVRWVALLAPVVAIVGAWSMRPVDGGMERAWQNLVQGSHPMYHVAYVNRLKDPRMMEINAEIEREMGVMLDAPAKGLADMGSRLAQHPVQTLAWYVSKAWLLWDWSIRIGPADGPYMHVVEHSPLDEPPMRSVVSALRVANPALFALAFLFAAAAVWRPGSARMLALSFLYFTAVHVALQAEPRYSIPYRPIELLLAVAAVALAVSWVKSRSAPPTGQPRPSS